MSELELKTLKDFIGMTIDDQQFYPNLTSGIIIRKEVIKWIKEIRKKIEEFAIFKINGIDFYYSREREEWIKHFFNISEDDLK